MLKAWIRGAMYILQPNMDPSQQVVMRQPKGSTYPPHAICSEGFNHLTTARSGSVSLCFKNDKAQTFGLLAPGCENELSGLDPANTAAFSFVEGHTETKGYSGGIGLCQLHGNPTIKAPTGRDSLQEFQSTNYVKEPRRTASHARNLRRLAGDIVISMGGNDECLSWNDDWNSVRYSYRNNS